MVYADYEASEPRRFLPQAEGHTFNLTAEFADLAAARRAGQSLREAGIADAQAIVVARRGEEVSTDTGLSADDRIILGAFGRWITAGLTAGVVFGGVLGLIAGLIVIRRGPDLWEAAIAGAIFGAGMGGMTAGICAAGLRTSRAATHRHHPELDHAVLYVQAALPDGIGRAESILRGLATLNVARLQPVEIAG